MSSPLSLPSPPAEPPGAALILLPACALIGVALILDATVLDLLASDPFYDPVRHVFPMRRDWFYARVLHEGCRFLMVAVAVGSFLGFLASFRWSRTRAWRWPLLYLALCIALSSLTVSLLKQVSNRYCPWDITRYGGKVPHTSLFEGTPAPFTNGHGWPAGHAAPALALCCLYLIARAHGARRAFIWLLPCILVGGFFAWVQQARGAHFLSHNLWSAAIGWLVACLLARVFARLGWRLGPA